MNLLDLILGSQGGNLGPDEGMTGPRPPVPLYPPGGPGSFDDRFAPVMPRPQPPLDDEAMLPPMAQLRSGAAPPGIPIVNPPLPRPRPPEAGPSAADLPAVNEASGGRTRGLLDAVLGPPKDAGLSPGVSPEIANSLGAPRQPLNVPLAPQPAPAAPAPTDGGSDLDRLAQLISGSAIRDNPMRRITSSLAGGLKSINGQAFPLQAFANALGGGLEGGNQAQEAETTDRLKALDAAIKVKSLTDKPTFGKIGQDAFGTEQYGFINPGQQTVTPYAAPQGGTATGTVGGVVGTQPTGEAALKGMPTPMQSLVKKIANYEIDPRTLSVKGGHRERVLAAVAQYDPSYDAPQYASRAAAIKEFNSGGPNSPASIITAGNTAIQHLGALSDAAEKLDNTRFPIWNSVANQYLNQTGDPRITSFNTIRNKLVEEGTRFYRGVGGNEADIKRDIAELNSAQSPQQLRAAAKTFADLMQSKINTLQDRWKTATGPSGWNTATRQAGQDFPITQKKSAEQLSKITARNDPQQAISDAKAAIQGGAPREAVIQRLNSWGMDTSGL